MNLTLMASCRLVRHRRTLWHAPDNALGVLLAHVADRRQCQRILDCRRACCRRALQKEYRGHQRCNEYRTRVDEQSRAQCVHMTGYVPVVGASPRGMRHPFNAEKVTALNR